MSAVGRLRGAVWRNWLRGAVCRNWLPGAVWGNWLPGIVRRSRLTGSGRGNRRSGAVWGNRVSGIVRRRKLLRVAPGRRRIRRECTMRMRSRRQWHVRRTCQGWRLVRLLATRRHGSVLRGVAARRLILAHIAQRCIPRPRFVLSRFTSADRVLPCTAIASLTLTGTAIAWPTSPRCAIAWLRLLWPVIAPMPRRGSGGRLISIRRAIAAVVAWLLLPGDARLVPAWVRINDAVTVSAVLPVLRRSGVRAWLATARSGARAPLRTTRSSVAVRDASRGVLQWSSRGVLQWAPRGVFQWVSRGVVKWAPRGVFPWFPRAVLQWVPPGVLPWTPRGVLRWTVRALPRGYWAANAFTVTLPGRARPCGVITLIPPRPFATAELRTTGDQVSVSHPAPATAPSCATAAPVPSTHLVVSELACRHVPRVQRTSTPRWSGALRSPEARVRLSRTDIAPPCFALSGIAGEQCGMLGPRDTLVRRGSTPALGLAAAPPVHPPAPAFRTHHRARCVVASRAPPGGHPAVRPTATPGLRDA